MMQYMHQYFTSNPALKDVAISIHTSAGNILPVLLVFPLHQTPLVATFAEEVEEAAPKRVVGRWPSSKLLTTLPKKKTAIVQAKCLEIQENLTSQRNKTHAAKRKYIEELTRVFNGRSEAKAKVQEYRRFRESKSSKEDTDSDSDSDEALSLTAKQQNLAKDYLVTEKQLLHCGYQINKYENMIE